MFYTNPAYLEMFGCLELDGLEEILPPRGDTSGSLFESGHAMSLTWLGDRVGEK